MNSILVITTLPDVHLEMVRPFLESDLQIFDPSKFPFDEDLTYQLTSFGQLSISIRSGGLNQVSAVWYRKPRYLTTLDLDALGVPVEYHQFTLENYRRAVTSVWDLLDNCYWVSRARNIEKGNNKLLQLQLAVQIGFRVPATLVTTSDFELSEFRSKHELVIVKCLHYPMIALGGTNHVFRTTRIGPSEEIDTSGLGIAPAIFQEEVPKLYDIRVTIVGDQIFPVKIEKLGDSINEVDWKAGIAKDELTYTPIDLTTNVMDQCFSIVKALGLEFGAIDLVMSRDEDIWFLEINPNGQWGFIERYTGLPLARAMANLLNQGSK